MDMNRISFMILILTGSIAVQSQITYADFEPYTFHYDPITPDSMMYRMMRPLGYDSLNPVQEYPLFLWMHPNGKQGL